MARRIIIFGATGFTGRLVAERLAVQGAAPVLAGRSEGPVRELAERLGAEWRSADALRRNSVFALLERGDVLVSTVGPFAKWGEPAVRAAIAAGGTYIDSTGEPAFIRRVFEEFGPPAERAGATLLTAMGYDFVPGTLAAALALRGGRRRGGARRRRLLRVRRRDQRRHARARRSGSCSTRATRSATARCGRRGSAERVRSFHVKGKAARGDLDRRLRAPHAAGELSRAARGQRLPRLVRRAGAAAAGGQPGRLAGDEACRACAA